MDERQALRAWIGLRVLLVVALAYIAWPLALLIAVLIAVRYGFAYLPPGLAFLRRIAIPTIILVVAVTYPFYNGSLTDMRLLGAFPDVGTAVIMGVYVIMAIGLNIVVGYAGLLDLGYVAFYAMGAYTCAWFAPVQFAHRPVHLGAVAASSSSPRSHSSIW